MEEVKGEIIDWVDDLLEEIEKPTFFDKVMACSLISAEVESWNKDSTIIQGSSSADCETLMTVLLEVSS